MLLLSVSFNTDNNAFIVFDRSLDSFHVEALEINNFK